MLARAGGVILILLCAASGSLAEAEADAGILGHISETSGSRNANTFGSLAASPAYPSSGMGALRKAALAAGLIKAGSTGDSRAVDEHLKASRHAGAAALSSNPSASSATKAGAQAAEHAQEALASSGSMETGEGRKQREQTLIAVVPEDHAMVEKNGVIQGVEQAVMDLNRDIRQDDTALKASLPLPSLAEEERKDATALAESTPSSHPLIRFPSFTEDLAEKPSGPHVKTVHDAIQDVSKDITALGSFSPAATGPAAGVPEGEAEAVGEGDPFDPATPVDRIKALASTQAEEKEKSEEAHAKYVDQLLEGRKKDAEEASALASTEKEKTDAFSEAIAENAEEQKKAMALEEGKDAKTEKQKHFEDEMDAVNNVRLKIIMDRDGKVQEKRDEFGERLAHHDIQDLSKEEQKMYEFEEERKRDDEMAEHEHAKEQREAAEKLRLEKEKEKAHEERMAKERDEKKAQIEEGRAAAEHVEAAMRHAKENAGESKLAQREERREAEHEKEVKAERARREEAHEAEVHALSQLSEKQRQEREKQAAREEREKQEEAKHEAEVKQAEAVRERREEVEAEKLKVAAARREAAHKSVLAEDEAHAKVQLEEQKGREIARAVPRGEVVDAANAAQAADEAVKERAAEEKRAEEAKHERWVEETREREAKRAQLIEAEHRAHADRLAKLHMEQARAQQIRHAEEHEKAVAFEKGQKDRAGAVRRKVVSLQKAIDMEHGDKAKLDGERRREREALRGEYEKARHAVVVGKAALRLSRKQVQEARERVKLGARGNVGQELASHKDALAMLEAKVGKDEERVKEIEHKLYASSDARRL